MKIYLVLFFSISLLLPFFYKPDNGGKNRKGFPGYELPGLWPVKNGPNPSVTG